MAAARRIILLKRAIEAGKLIDPPAWNYDNLVGAIWLGDPGHSGYDNAPTGQIEVRDPSGTDALGQTQGGYYDNRT